MKKINIPRKIHNIPEGCFKNSGIEVALIPDNVTSLSTECFNVRSLKALKITHKDLTNISFTESSVKYVDDVILYVPEGSKKLYSEFYPWKDFKEIIEYKDQEDEFAYNVYRINCKNDVACEPQKSAVLGTEDVSSNIYAYNPSGIDFTLPDAPEIEGYEFVRWENIPAVMPAADIEVTAVYKVVSGIDAVKTDDVQDCFYTLDGVRIDRPSEPGIYICNGRKIVIK